MFAEPKNPEASLSKINLILDDDLKSFVSEIKSKWEGRVSDSEAINYMLKTLKTIYNNVGDAEEFILSVQSGEIILVTHEHKPKKFKQVEGCICGGIIKEHGFVWVTQIHPRCPIHSMK